MLFGLESVSWASPFGVRPGVNPTPGVNVCGLPGQDDQSLVLCRLSYSPVMHMSKPPGEQCALIPGLGLLQSGEGDFHRQSCSPLAR